MFRSLLCGMLPPDRKSPISSFPPHFYSSFPRPPPSFPATITSFLVSLPSFPHTTHVIPA